MNWMRVVFDARHLQTVSRARGIGRYSRNLLAAFARKAPSDLTWTLLRLGTFPAADLPKWQVLKIAHHPDGNPKNMKTIGIALHADLK